jgi:hydrogenase-1 operon protein HyaF
MRALPIPVVAFGPGSQAEAEPPVYFDMPKDMATYRPPALPDPGHFAAHRDALAALAAVQRAVDGWLAGGTPEPIELGGLDAAGRALVDQVLGEGEVAAQVTGDPGVQAQESVFAGVWRVLELERGAVVRDAVEVGPVPRVLLAAALADAIAAPVPAGPPAAETMNAPSVYEELLDRSRRWCAGEPAHVVNLTLLPLSEGDSLYLEARLAAGRVQLLSRGYGNCRIVGLRLPHVWRVSYFNSQDRVILDTLEVGGIPEVACAAREDLEDTAVRLREVLEWVARS